MMLASVKAGTLLVATMTFVSLRAQMIRSPWDGHPVTLTSVPTTCAQVGVVPADLNMDGFYSLNDPTHSIIDPERMAAYTKSSAPAKGAALAVIDVADRYRTTGSRPAAVCTISLLMELASSNALAGRMSSSQAYYVQGWLAGAMAIAFLKVRESDVASTEQTATIAAWLNRIAKSTCDWYDADLRRRPYGNNHLYWAGLELCAIAVVANDRKDLDWGISAYRNGVDQIAPDGTLPLEMKRGSRALHYHLYAVAPLVLIAEFGESNGVSLYKESHGALARLVRVSIEGLGKPAFFDRQTGVSQEIPSHPSGDAIGWAPPYLARYPDATLQMYVTQAPSLMSFYLGGLPAPVPTVKNN